MLEGEGEGPAAVIRVLKDGRKGDQSWLRLTRPRYESFHRLFITLCSILFFTSRTEEHVRASSTNYLPSIYRILLKLYTNLSLTDHSNGSYEQYPPDMNSDYLFVIVLPITQ
jgi:hypothetical protein